MSPLKGSWGHPGFPRSHFENHCPRDLRVQAGQSWTIMHAALWRNREGPEMSSDEVRWDALTDMFIDYNYSNPCGHSYAGHWTRIFSAHSCGHGGGGGEGSGTRGIWVYEDRTGVTFERAYLLFNHNFAFGKWKKYCSYTKKSSPKGTSRLGGSGGVGVLSWEVGLGELIFIRRPRSSWETPALQLPFSSSFFCRY